MPEVKLGIPSVVEAALLPRLMGSGHAAALDQTVSSVVGSLMAGDRSAIAMQEELLQLWQEQPLGASIAASVERFAQAYAAGAPGRLMRAPEQGNLPTG